MKTMRNQNIDWVVGVGVMSLALLMTGCGNKETNGPAVNDTKAALVSPTEGLKTSSGIELVAIPSGSFMMGDEKGESDEKPVHKVQITAFEMDKFEVTQKRYQSLMGKNPSRYKGAERPVEQVSWVDAIQYCNLRSTKEGLQPCYDLKSQVCNFEATGYRLPTEAEWEYACRAGTVTAYSFGADTAKLGQYGWNKENSEKTTHPVGQKKANAWGIYDTHGNVQEWCHDVYDKGYYGRSTEKDPKGPTEGAVCVLRGGSWKSSAESCRSSARNSETPKFADVCFGADEKGFRCVRRPIASSSVN